MKKKLVVFIVVGLLALMLSVFARNSSSYAEANNNPESLIPPGPVTEVPTKTIEVDLIYDFKIPTKEEIAETKKKTMESSDYKEKEKSLGKEQAENGLDKELKKDFDYMVEMNQKGKEKIQIAKLGENSAYFTQWTYGMNSYGQCTAEAVDPMNLFFYNRGADTDVANHLWHKGWGLASVGDDQCAWTGTYQKNPLYTSDLRQQHMQWQLGSWDLRDHIRFWSAPYDSYWGYWSVASTHHEFFDPWYGLTHCVNNYDNSEGYVVERMGFPTWYWDSPNGPANYYKCGNPVYNDGWTPMVNVTWTY